MHYKYFVHKLDQQSDSAQTTFPIMEHLAIFNSDKYSTAIFSALPQKGTYLKSECQFPECIHTVLGLPSPFFASFQQQVIGCTTTLISLIHLVLALPMQFVQGIIGDIVMIN